MKWIKIEDELPEVGNEVLLYSKIFNHFDVGKLSGTNRWNVANMETQVAFGYYDEWTKIIKD